ncbi:neuroblastoma breakpoint family member 4-like [Choloepus didactylus]|uniref:neuroblastoma breakpoint family member 4-like n=1 Tax=Choloepus didactylus TaxID=27675 RepID=UPI00189EADEE|nr:neuroblastoma breakpoint family member 4-like [Choloepus didactylus]
MADSCSTSCDPRTEMNIQEINQELCSQLAKCKQDFRDLWEKFLLSQATSYSLANQLQKYKAKEHKDILESVLGEKLQFEEEELAEKPGAAAGLGKYTSPIPDQMQELVLLKQKIQKVMQMRKVKKRKNDWLPEKPDRKEEEGQEPMSSRRCSLAFRNSPLTFQRTSWDAVLFCALTLCLILYPPYPSTLTMEVQKQEEMNEVHPDTVDEGSLPPFGCHELSDYQEPPSNMALVSDEPEFCSPLHEASEYSYHREQICCWPPGKSKGTPEYRKKKASDPDLSQHLEDLFNHKDSDNFKTQRFSEQLVEARRLAAHVYSKFSTAENHEFKKYEDIQGLPVPRRELTWLRQKVEEGRQASFLLNQHFKDLVTHNDPDKYQTQSFLEQLVEGCQMVKCLAYKRKTENYEDEEDEEEESLDPRLSSELEKDTMEEVLQDTVDEHYLSPSNHRDLTDSQQPPAAPPLSFMNMESSVFWMYPSPREASNLALWRPLQSCRALSQNHPQAGLGLPQGLWEILRHPSQKGAPSWDTCHPGPMIGAWSDYMSDVQALQLQLMPSPLVNNWLQLQLDHQWISGDYTPRFSPFSNIWSFTANVDSGNQWPPFQGMKTSLKVECDSLDSSAANNHGCQITGHDNTTSDFKQKIMRRKLRFHKWKLVCRFPGLHIQA